ncbi:HypC/HybG/HupF family hydrogenase formation chaperone [Amycolatopsis alkalitolerans]|uniref:HypC/HybG/HupF family hydrogenase formation chaperone n=1 Tax=Amycolatopsis alkalitolerans TaxID=2547244 RepID=A0A5C4LSY7_9PSEU|nr:HypC/HybG/HupF family hydrogenase formation chaperone [Amycolatopsis alkalitolerans]TNC21789.1 HypC/HybG/HupF family hydrogenase formation chaperone [Amycolatopsis alkalitolerans]
MCLAIPARIIRFRDAERFLADVEVSGVRRAVNVSLVPDDVEEGDWVLVHVGFAIAVVDEDEARATLRTLEELGQAYDDEIAALRDSHPG